MQERLRFIESMKVLNVKLTDIVVCYDSDGASAFQIAFAIEAMGHMNVSVLNGGLESWSEQKFLTVDRP